MPPATSTVKTFKSETERANAAIADINKLFMNTSLDWGSLNSRR